MKNLIFGIVLSVLPAFSYSQSSPFDCEINRIPFLNPVNDFDTTYGWYCYLNLNDTSNVSKIHLKMGTNYGGGQLVDHSFTFDMNAFLPSGLSYRRDTSLIKLGLGNYLLRNYYIEVRLEDTSNVVSAPVYWNNL